MISAVNTFLDDLRGGRMSDAPIVNVESGELQGRVVTNENGKSFYSFQGIPYAKPPLGSLRFKAPQPPEPWDGVRDATTEGNVSAQIDKNITQAFAGDENCLFLNVYTPNIDGEFLPVMVFIHGGGFRFGSGSSTLYGGDYLVEKDVVVVTVNYRCGPLGFLSLNTPEVPGNAGLKDMVQAVRWIKENIGQFGGNSGNLTVFGNSCGGAAVSLLTASPLTKNLISKAIIQSGTALNSFVFQNHPIDNARDLAKNLGSDAEDVDEILDFLSATSVRDLVEATEKMHPPELFYERGENIFSPVIEKEFLGVEAVLTEAFIDILTSGRVSEIPIMIGTTTLEFTPENRAEDLQVLIPGDLNVERNSADALAISDRFKQLYFDGRSHTAVETLNEYYQLISDRLINADTHRYVQYLVQVSNKPIYYYKFDYVGELNLTKISASLGFNHAGHQDEIGYLFKNDLVKNVEPTPQDVKLRERMLRLWTNFAKSGNPTPEENHYLTVTWLPVTKDNNYYLNLSNELSLNTNPDQEKMDFWQGLYNKYYKIWDHPKINNEEAPRKEPTPVKLEPEPVEETKVDVVEETKVDVVEEVVEVVAEDVAETIKEPVATEAVATHDVTDRIEEDTNEVVEDKPNNVYINGNGVEAKPRTSNEIKMVNQNGVAKDVIRANDPPEDDLPKNIGVNKFVNFFESLGGKK